MMNDLETRIDEIVKATEARFDLLAGSVATIVRPQARPIGETWTGLAWWKQEGFLAATNYGSDLFSAPTLALNVTDRVAWYQGARLGRSTLSKATRRAQRRVKLSNLAFLRGMVQP